MAMHKTITEKKKGLDELARDHSLDSVLATSWGRCQIPEKSTKVIGVISSVQAMCRALKKDEDRQKTCFRCMETLVCKVKNGGVHDQGGADSKLTAQSILPLPEKLRKLFMQMSGFESQAEEAGEAS